MQLSRENKKKNPTTKIRPTPPRLLARGEIAYHSSQAVASQLNGFFSPLPPGETSIFHRHFISSIQSFLIYQKVQPPPSSKNSTFSWSLFQLFKVEALNES